VPILDFGACGELIYSLPETYPHHKYVPPDIKHNRVPAPEISFHQPNLRRLIEEIDREILC
jgi:hypothetical protein